MSDPIIPLAIAVGVVALLFVVVMVAGFGWAL